MVIKRKYLLVSAFISIVATINLIIFIPASRFQGDFWDCSLSFEQALTILGVIIAFLTFGVWFLGCSRSLIRGLGFVFLFIAGLYIWVIHHAGRNWGINRFDNPQDCYSPNAVSVFVVLLIIACIGLVIYFSKRSSSTDLHSAT
jgi:hypothetical protein